MNHVLKGDVIVKVMLCAIFGTVCFAQPTLAQVKYTISGDQMVIGGYTIAQSNGEEAIPPSGVPALDSCNQSIVTGAQHLASDSDIAAKLTALAGLYSSTRVPEFHIFYDTQMCDTIQWNSSSAIILRPCLQMGSNLYSDLNPTDGFWLFRQEHTVTVPAIPASAREFFFQGEGFRNINVPAQPVHRATLVGLLADNGQYVNCGNPVLKDAVLDLIQNAIDSRRAQIDRR
jgi:hypothetical protein